MPLQSLTGKCHLLEHESVLGIHNLSKGTTNGVTVDIKLIFAIVLKACAIGIIVAHNHSSGALKPSSTDLSLKRKIKKSAHFLDIVFLDHLRQCEICNDLAGGINTFKKDKEDITPEEFHQQLHDEDEASLEGLKFPENPKDLIGEMFQKLSLPEAIEKRIREVLEFSEDENFGK